MTNGKRLWRVVSWSTTAPTPCAHIVAHRLKLLPLLRRQHFLQTRISLAPNLIHSRLRFPPQRPQLFARVAENLLHLRLLIGVEIEPLRQHLEPVARR